MSSWVDSGLLAARCTAAPPAVSVRTSAAVSGVTCMQAATVRSVSGRSAAKRSRSRPSTGIDRSAHATRRAPWSARVRSATSLTRCTLRRMTAPEIDVATVFAEGQGFLRTLGPTLVEATTDRAVLRLDAGPELHNHLGGPHAAALFGLGELAAFALLLKAFGDLVQDGGVPLIKGASVEYQALTVGPVLATARLADEPQPVRERFAERGSASFDVEVVFRLEAGDAQTAVMRPRMTIKRF